MYNVQKMVLCLLISFAVISFISCATTGSNNVAIIKAIEEGDTIKVKNLLEKGFNVDSINSAGKTLLMLACEGANLELVKVLVEKGANINARDIAEFFSEFDLKLGINYYLFRQNGGWGYGLRAC